MKNKKCIKKGFTLIELLAVILILAIISLIATPIILNIIDDVNKSSAEISMDNLRRAVDLYYERKELNGTFQPTTFICKDGICKNESESLDISGNGIQSGIINIGENGDATYQGIFINGQKCNIVNKEVTCELGYENIINSDTNELVINNKNYTVLNNYKIYGSSSSLGDIISGKYIIPITIRGKNLFNPQLFLDKGATLQDDGSYYFANANLGKGIIIWENVDNYTGQITIKYKVKYSNSTTRGNYFVFYFEDGSKNEVWGTRTQEYYEVMYTSPVSKKVVRIETDYGTQATGTNFLNVQIEKGISVVNYEPYVEPKNYTIELTSPLKENEYIEFAAQKVVRSNGTTEDIKLPIISLLNVETILEVNTKNLPGKIEVTYVK